MKISVVTASYNAGSTIGDTLRSVAAQSWPDVEHIVIDGASKDDTAAIVAAHQRPGGIYVNEPDRGIYDAMNKGLARATGDVIGLLNADDFYADDGALEKVAHAFDQHKCDAVLGDVGFVRDGAHDRVIRRYDSGMFRPSRIAWGWMPAHPAMFLTREAYERVGNYRTDYRIASDFEFVVRAFAKAGISYVHLPEMLVRMRIGGVSTGGLKAKLTINRECLRACRENGIYSNSLMIASKYPMKLAGLLR